MPERPPILPPADHGHRRAEILSIELHRAYAARLDENMVVNARKLLDEWAAKGTLAPFYAQKWTETLALPQAELAQLLAADTQEMRDLRQNSPFAGALPEDERLKIVAYVHRTYDLEGRLISSQTK